MCRVHQQGSATLHNNNNNISPPWLCFWWEERFPTTTPRLKKNVAKETAPDKGVSSSTSGTTNKKAVGSESGLWHGDRLLAGKIFAVLPSLVAVAVRSDVYSRAQSTLRVFLFYFFLAFFFTPMECVRKVTPASVHACVACRNYCCR